MFLTIYDGKTRVKLAETELAFLPTENMVINSVYEMNFSLPYNSATVAHCKPYNYARIGRSKELYRIITPKETYKEDGTHIMSYKCEHVFSMLINNSIFGSYTPVGLSTRQVLTSILNKQPVVNWVLGDCDFNLFFSYTWRNETLLTMVLDVPELFLQPYKFEFDTNVYPWVLHLRKINIANPPEFYVWRKSNLKEFERTWDYSNVVNRMYALGNGEGDDNLNRTMVSMYNGGKPYVDATKTPAPYTIEGIFEDRKYTDGKALLDALNAMMAAMSVPRESVAAKAADLSFKANSGSPAPYVGKTTMFEGWRSYITRYFIDYEDRNNNEIEMANSPNDIAKVVADYMNRLRANSNYAAGAPNIWQDSQQQNCTPTIPLLLSIYVPATVQVVNRVNLRYKFDRFRNYAVTAEQSEQGITTAESNSRQTSSTQPGESYTSTTQPGQASTSDYYYPPTETTNSSSVNSTTQPEEITQQQFVTERTTLDYSQVGKYSHGHTYFLAADDLPHVHGISHTHTVYLQRHSHNFTPPAHNHSVSTSPHSHTVEPHTHRLTIPAHTHKMVTGMTFGPRATSATIKIEGVAIPFAIPANTDYDIAPYIPKDADGLIKRGQTIEVEIYPNTDSFVMGTLTPIMYMLSDGNRY